MEMRFKTAPEPMVNLLCVAPFAVSKTAGIGIPASVCPFDLSIVHGYMLSILEVYCLSSVLSWHQMQTLTLSIGPSRSIPQ